RLHGGAGPHSRRPDPGRAANGDGRVKSPVRGGAAALGASRRTRQMVRDRARSFAGYPQVHRGRIVSKTVAGAKRLGRIPPYLFAEIDRKVQEKKRAGIDVISLGIGDPDLPTPGRIVSVLQETAADPANHRYASYFGLSELRESIARWYSERSGVELD